MERRSASGLIRAMALASGLIGLVALMGWVMDIALLKSVIPGAVQMKPNTALGLLAAALALDLLHFPGRERAARVGLALGGLLLALGAATFAQYLFDWNLGLDEALFKDTARAFNQQPGRMSPYSALVFAALGLVFLLWQIRAGQFLRILLADLIVGIGVLAVLGYFLQSQEMVTDDLVPPIAVHTAIAFVLLGIGIDLHVRRQPQADGRDGHGNLALQSNVAIGMGGAFALLLLGGVVTVRSYVHVSDAEKWISHTLEVRSLLGKQLVSFTQAESNMRAYLLTGLPRYRELAESAADEARGQLSALLPLVVDNEEQAGRLSALDGLTRRRLEQVAQRMDTYDARGLAALQPDLSRASGGRLSMELQQASLDMDQAEAVLLPMREQRALKERRKATFFLAVTLLGSALALLVLTRSIWHEVAARARAERELGRLNADLEQRVQQRGLDIEARYHQFVDLFQFSPDGLVMTDADGCIRRMNRRAEEMFGWAQSEAEGLPVEHLLPLAARAGHVGLRSGYVQHAVQRPMAAGRPNLQAQRRDGTAFPVDVSLCPLKTPEGLMIVASVRDITERQRAEQEVLRYRDHLQELVTERTAELEQALQGAAAANVAKSNFLANMSHEIRTPLGAIVGMARLVRKGTLSAEQTDKLGKLEAAASHVIATINDILDLSKIEADKLVLEQGPVDIAELMDTVVNILDAQARQKQLALHSRPASLPAGLHGDATRIRQALLNYASNAIKFTEAGEVILRATVLEDGVDSSLIRLDVSDTGPGVSPEKMERLFGLFEQADSTITRRFGGTGLGLAITKRLARAMGGDVGVHSTPGQGSTFWLSLRLQKQAGAGAPGALPPAVDLESLLQQCCAGKKVLVVEDDEFNREIASILLAELGMQVAIAPDGLQGLEMATQSRYDLILMDMQMPRMDGLEATRRIRGLPDGAAVPIWAMTANAFTEDRDRCLAAGMDGFLTKPIQLDLLRQKLLALFSPARGAQAAST